MEYVTLEVGFYDELSGIDEYLEFEVPKDWLMREFDIDDVGAFLDEYCTEDSATIYSQALLDGVLVVNLTPQRG